MLEDVHHLSIGIEKSKEMGENSFKIITQFNIQSASFNERDFHNF
jgi:hypothetical protein